MKKKSINKTTMMFICLAMNLGLAACGSSQNAETDGANKSETVEEEQTPQEMNLDDFDALLSEQPLVAVNAVYEKNEYDFIYAGRVNAGLKNNSTADIREAVVAFAAWDENDLPVKFEDIVSFESPEYIMEGNYTDINLEAGGSYEEEYGFGLDNNENISRVKAIAVSFITFNDETWTNPYYNDFRELYEGKKYSEDLTVTIDEIVAPEFETATQADKTEKTTVSAAELDGELSEQPVRVTETMYTVQSDDYKSIYPDMLQAIVANESDKDIKNMDIAFAAWDENGLPVKIEGQYDFSGGEYIKEVTAEGVNLTPGGTYGESNGFGLSENCNVSEFKAIVKSYETFEGEIWNNPLYRDFCELYGGKKLS